MAQIDTRQAILDAARAAVQARGYNALSFREIAKQVGVKSASIHYHFPTKGDLGAAVARRYTDEALATFDALLASGADAADSFRAYAGVFRAALADDNRMCLCGIMLAEHDELPAAVRAEVARFAEVNVRWIATVLGGRDSSERALAIYAAIGGAQLVARGRNDIALFDRALAAYRSSGLIP